MTEESPSAEGGTIVAAYTVAVPGIFLADKPAASATDRGHSLSSLHLPQAAVASLPQDDRKRRK